MTDQLRKECVDEKVSNPPPKDRRSVDLRAGASPDLSPRPSMDSGAPPFASTSSSAASTTTTTPPLAFDPAHVPSLARERNRLTLRAYLRSILANPVLASSDAFQSFLLESPIEMNPKEQQDVLIREEMDRIREQEMRSFRAEVEERVEELEGYLRKFREELVKHDGLSRVFGTIRRTENVQDLPIEYRKVMEWARIS